MRPLALLPAALACLGLAACSGPARRDDTAQRRETARALRQAMESGRVQGAADPSFTPRLEEASLAWLLYRGPAPLAGARRLLDLRDRGHASAAIYLAAPGAERVAELSGSEAFRSGLFFNSYDPALFRPFFRHALVRALQDPGMDEDAFLALMEPLELALRLTPRFASSYPNLLDARLRADLQDFLRRRPEGEAADRFRMLLLWDERNRSWAAGRARADGQLAALADSTRDALLKLEIKDALAVQGARPERAFWMSLALPGLGQMAHGDVQGGLLLGGLTAAAWAWMAGKLDQAGRLEGDRRQVAYGDAAWAGSLALLGHAFTAYNAAEQARFINIVIQWDLLSKDRLQAMEGAPAAPAGPTP